MSFTCRSVSFTKPVEVGWAGPPRQPLATSVPGFCVQTRKSVLFRPKCKATEPLSGAFARLNFRPMAA